jgi:CRISPR type I-E-associated protein CasA/Cse1
MPSTRLDELRWIPVVGTDGRARRENLRSIFADARALSGIDGSPLEVAAITRFLLAVAHLTDTPTSLDAWATIWKGRLDFMSQCAKSVEQQPDAWDLFHKRHPFGQLPDLHKTLNPAHLLTYDAARKNNAVFADHSIGETPVPVPAASLARGLIVTNAFAGSSGGGYRSGPLAMRTVAMLCGRTFDETIVLNLLVQRTPPAAYGWRSYGHTAEGAPASVDIVRRYLWTSRQVRFLADATGAAAATMMLSPGDEMPETERAEDPMVAMRKDSKGTAYVPLRLDAGRALWRSAHVLLNWHEDARRLAAVDQLRKAVRRGLIPTGQQVSMRVCAVAGDAQGPSTELWRDESLPFGLSVIADESRYAELAKAVSEAEETGRTTRGRIYSFAIRYLQDGSEAAPDKANVARLADELAPDLTDFWAALARAGEQIACEGYDGAAWTSLLRQASHDTFTRAVRRLPPDARRYRAEFARGDAVGKKDVKGATA